MFLQILRIIGQARLAFRFNEAQGVGEGHVAAGEMVAVGLAVGGNAHQMVAVVPVVESIGQAAGQTLAIAEQPFEGHRLGRRGVVKENGDGTAGRQFHQVGHGNVHQAAIDILADLPVERADAAGLKGRENGELDTLFGQHVERLVIGGGFRQPHPFGLAAETGFKIANAPNYLGDFVAAAGQGHDDVVVALGKSGAVAGELFPACLVPVQDGLVNVRGLFLHQERRVGPKSKLILA